MLSNCRGMFVTMSRRPALDESITPVNPLIFTVAKLPEKEVAEMSVKISPTAGLKPLMAEMFKVPPRVAVPFTSN